jgi:hypothetical protein
MRLELGYKLTSNCGSIVVHQVAQASRTKKAWTTPRVEHLTADEALGRIMHANPALAPPLDQRRCG